MLAYVKRTVYKKSKAIIRAAATAAACVPLQELKGLTVVLDTSPAPSFCLELAALAARREYLNLEKWLSDQFTAKGSAFMQSAVSFLDSKLRSEQPALQVGGPAGRRLRLGCRVVWQAPWCCCCG